MHTQTHTHTNTSVKLPFFKELTFDELSLVTVGQGAKVITICLEATVVFTLDRKFDSEFQKLDKHFDICTKDASGLFALK